MNYNETLQTQNNQLRTLISKVNTFPKAEVVRKDLLYEYINKQLYSISDNTIKSIKSQAFYNQWSLTTVSFPLCLNIDSEAFWQCQKLTNVNFPLCSYIGTSAFENCVQLAQAIFPKCQYIDARAFEDCHYLSRIFIGTSTVCILQNSNAFHWTPFSGYSVYFSGTPHIYVPQSLITDYQNATNWAYFSSYFSAIEDCT